MQCRAKGTAMSRPLQPRDEREARAWYCADAFSSARWGPTPAERERRHEDLDEDARAVETDLWLLRHAGIGQVGGAMGRLVDRINRSR
jgi:hypothetical protein